MPGNDQNLTPEEDKEYKPKKIVVCCDGTGNEYGEENTNVVKLFQRLKLENPEEQIAYYDPGVGTFSSPAAFTKTAKLLSRLKGLAFASGMTQNIEDAYIYLMDKYREGDKVYLFGFSRGAYTARSLGGMLNKCGLLQKGSNNLVPYASHIYRNKDNDEVAKGFKKTFSRECTPLFIGVWDTVKSVGFSPFFHREFSDSVLNPDIKFGCQALAIDERRLKFKPDIWCPPANEDEQVIEQVWFAGVHSDIGGSYPDSSLSDISLNWMLRQAHNRDLLIRKDELSGPDFVPKPCSKLHNSLKWYWLILGWKRRNIPKGSSIHQSVYDRINDCDYNPKNLPD